MLRIVLFGFALVAAVGAGWLAYSRLSTPPPDPEVVEALPTAEVLIAAAEIGRGATLGPGNLAWTDWPEQAVAPDMVQRTNNPDAIETYTGWIARHEITTGHPVQIGRIAESKAGLLALALTPGMRAIAVQTSAETSAGGFILPEDRVDVVHTIQEDIDGNGEEEPVSLTIIRNVRVLAVDQTAEPEEGETAKVGDTVTLELTPLQVELLTTARNSGRISLALRSVTDFGETETGDLALMPGLPLMVEDPADLSPTTVASLRGSAASGAPEANDRGEGTTGGEASDDAWFDEMFADDSEPKAADGAVNGGETGSTGTPDATDEGSRAEGGDEAESDAKEGEPAEVEIRLIGSGAVETVFVEPAR